MIKKFLSKYILEVIPSIFATVVGAYIVTHYINAKSDDKPKAAISAPAETSKEVAPQTLKADESGDKVFKESPKVEAARLKAEKLAAEKAAAERAAIDRAENAKKAAEKLAAEKLASEKVAAEKRERERTVAKSSPAAMPAEASAAPNDKRDANDLARAAIERLRNARTSEKASEKTSEPSRAPEAVRAEEPAKPQPERARINSVVYAPAAVPQPQIQPLPPAVTVAPPPSEAAIMAPPQPFPAPVSGSSESADDGFRPTPPADIPSRPLDLRARQRRSVTEDVVSAAKSMFHAVVPEQSN